MDRYPGLERRHDAASRSLISQRGRLVLTPVPHAGSTPLLHLLARGEGVADLVGEERAGAASGATIHDPSSWPTTLRWSEADAAVRSEAAESSAWMRLTTTRDPGARLWDAWQSIVLLRRADAGVRFGDAPWFPHRVETTDDLVAAFRAFVAALDSDDLLFADPAWTPQTLLLESMPPFTHRVDAAEVDAAVSLVAERFDVSGADLPDDPMLVEHVPAVFDAATAAVVNRLYGPDLDEFGHPRLPEEDAALPAAWRERVDTLLPAIALVGATNAVHEHTHRRRVDAEAQVELERRRVATLREQLDERWDSRHEDRAALVALTARLDGTEEELATARRELIDLTKGNRAPDRARQRARSMARRVRDRVATAREARSDG